MVTATDANLVNIRLNDTMTYQVRVTAPVNRSSSERHPPGVLLEVPVPIGARAQLLPNTASWAFPMRVVFEENGGTPAEATAVVLGRQHYNADGTLLDGIVQPTVTVISNAPEAAATSCTAVGVIAVRSLLGDEQRYRVSVSVPADSTETVRVLLTVPVPLGATLSIIGQTERQFSMRVVAVQSPVGDPLRAAATASDPAIPVTVHIEALE